MPTLLQRGALVGTPLTRVRSADAGSCGCRRGRRSPIPLWSFQGSPGATASMFLRLLGSGVPCDPRLGSPGLGSLRRGPAVRMRWRLRGDSHLASARWTSARGRILPPGRAGTRPQLGLVPSAAALGPPVPESPGCGRAGPGWDVTGTSRSLRTSARTHERASKPWPKPGFSPSFLHLLRPAPRRGSARAQPCPGWAVLPAVRTPDLPESLGGQRDWLGRQGCACGT